jgi:elongation factor Ts
MQVAAMAPVAIDKDDVDPKIIQQEIEIGKDQARQEGKPEEMLEKIALGKLNKFYKESTLLNQEFIKDSKKTVREYLVSVDKDLTVKAFYRLMLGA